MAVIDKLSFTMIMIRVPKAFVMAENLSAPICFFLFDEVGVAFAKLKWPCNEMEVRLHKDKLTSLRCITGTSVETIERRQILLYI